jgi:hypothetical protein
METVNVDHVSKWTIHGQWGQVYACIGLCEADVVMSSSEGIYLKWGTVGEREKGMGRKGGGQYTSNLGPE